MMKKKRTGWMSIFLLLQFTVFAALQAQTQLYVSPSGNDSNNGSSQHPFQTIEKAQAEARGIQGEVTVFLREATYRLTVPIRFTPQDGAPGKSLTIRAIPGEKAVLSGSVVLDNLQWRPHRNGILKTRVAGSPLMDMLTVNGEIRPMARYPNYDPDAVRFNGTAADATSPERVKTWENPAGGYLHAMHGSDWGDFHYRITGRDGEGNLSLEGGWQNNRPSGLHAGNRMVENIFEELDAPGEWFYDAGQSTLYYYPPEGEDVNGALFESPQIKCLMEFRGNASNPVRNITVEGIDLTQTLRTFMEPYEPLLRSDWTVYRGGAVFLEGAEHCSLKNCNLYNLGGNAVFFSNYNRYDEVSGSHFTRIGASAVCFVGDPGAVRSPSFAYPEFVPAAEIDRARGPKSDNYPADCRVHDNLIHRIGLYEKQITGVELSMCRAVTVSHNSIYDTPRAGINVSEGTWGGHVIEFNDVFNTVRETGDHGSFNSWGRDRYWHPNGQTLDSLLTTNHRELIMADAVETVIIRNNRFRCDRGWDIDLDDGSTNYHIYNNLCLNGGLKLREGFYRVVENNILVNNTLYRHAWFKDNGNVFTRNIVMLPYERPFGHDVQGALTDYNIFTDSLAYKTAREYGADANSIVSKVEFIDPASGDFRLSHRSTEAFRMGFQNFEMNRFGVVSDRLKVLAEKPEMPAAVVASGDVSESEILTWEGVQIKNLETLGERSATGMDSERGVYVVAIAAYGAHLIDYLKSNDVILGFAGKPVNNLAGLFDAIAGANLNEPQQITVFRHQREQAVTLPAGIIRANIRAEAQPELQFRPDGKFVIMQITDLHWNRKRDDRMWNILKQGIQAVRPDLIMVTGDVVTDTDTRNGWEKVTAVLAESGIPWAVTFGNHDREHDMTKPEIVELLKTKPGNLTENGPEDVSGNSNFILKIASSKTSGKTASVLYCFDTRQQEDGIDSTQIAWYRQHSRDLTAANGNKPLPGLAYFHIPVTEFKAVAGSPAIVGAFDEPVCDPPHNSGALSAFAEGGDVMGAFVGHDHTNNFIGIYNNICLAYGYTTLLSDSRYKTGRGARVVELTEGQRTFATWLVQLWEEPKKGKAFPFKPKAEIRNKVIYPSRGNKRVDE